MSNQRAVQFLMAVSCLGLFGCSQGAQQQADQGEQKVQTGALADQGVANTPAAQADQAAWQVLTKAAEDARAKNDKAGAEKNYKAAIAEALKLGADTPAVASSTANLADFYYVQGDGNQADELYKRSLATYEKTVGTQHFDLVVDLAGLGKVALLRKKYADAIAYYQRASDIATKSGNPVPTDVVKGLAAAQQMAKQPPIPNHK